MGAQPVGEFPACRPFRMSTGRFPPPGSTSSVRYHGHVASELIDAKDPHRPSRRVRQAVDPTQQHRPADRHAQRGRQPRPGGPANANASTTNASCAPAVRCACGCGSGPRPARRTYRYCSPPDSRRSGAPAAAPPLADRRPADPPGSARSCCAPESTPTRSRRIALPFARGCAAFVTTQSTRQMTSTTSGDSCGSSTRQQHLSKAMPPAHQHPCPMAPTSRRHRARRAAFPTETRGDGRCGQLHGTCARTR